jgi:hypothetical protein
MASIGKQPGPRCEGTPLAPLFSVIHFPRRGIPTNARRASCRRSHTRDGKSTLRSVDRLKFDDFDDSDRAYLIRTSDSSCVQLTRLIIQTENHHPDIICLSDNSNIIVSPALDSDNTEAVLFTLVLSDISWIFHTSQSFTVRWWLWFLHPGVSPCQVNGLNRHPRQLCDVCRIDRRP